MGTVSVIIMVIVVIVVIVVDDVVVVVVVDVDVFVVGYASCSFLRSCIT